MSLHRTLNVRFFGGRLQSIPVVWTASLPYGRAAAHYDGHAILVRRTAQNVPEVLLHECLHQLLHESGAVPMVPGRDRDAAHNHPAWCQGVQELTQAIWKVTVKAAPEQVQKVRLDGKRRSIRCVPPGCLSRRDLAGWPLSLGLHLPLLAVTTAPPVAAAAFQVPQPVPVVQPETAHDGKRGTIPEDVVPAPAAPKRRRKSLREPSEDPHVRQFSIQLHNRLKGSRLYVRGLVDHFRRAEFCRQLLEAVAAVPVNTTGVPASIDGVAVVIVKLHGNFGGFMVRVKPA
jgi:hypothetical protein